MNLFIIALIYVFYVMFFITGIAYLAYLWALIIQATGVKYILMDVKNAVAKWLRPVTVVA